MQKKIRPPLFFIEELIKLIKVNFSISSEFLSPNAPCEVNLDSSTVEKVQDAMKKPSRYTFDEALLHVYSLMEKDTYPRFLRSSHYRDLLLNSLHPAQKKK